MFFKISCVFLLAVYITVANGSGAGNWNYRLAGPAHWGNLHSQCDGSNQSPIDIETLTTFTNTNLHVDYLGEYKVTSTTDILVLNTGTNVEAEPLNGTFEVEAPCAWAAHAKKSWELEQFHWHWGGSNLIGSEHTIDGHRYPMEMHMVHYNKEYGTFDAAKEQSDGLLVLAFFIDTSPHTENNTNFQLIDDALPHIQYEGNQRIERDFSVFSLIEDSASEGFYYYQGSLTTPSCDEVVTWIIYHQPIMVSEWQLDSFRNLYFTGTSSAAPMEMVDNFRSTQAVNDRVIHSSVESVSSKAEASKAVALLTCLLLLRDSYKY